MNLKNTVKINLKNIPGKRFKSKYLLIECDDWGSIRMPSADVYRKLTSEGLLIPDEWSRTDTLADKDDLDELFNVLLSVKDKNSRNAVMTPVTNVANPDFNKIRDCGFAKYFYEPFTETLKRYDRHPDTFNTWKKGMEYRIFMPESHGREHITVQLWLRKLIQGDKKVLQAFDQGFVSVSLDDIPWVYREFRPEFYFDDWKQTEFLKNSITDGVGLFREVFGYTPHTFVPSNGIFHTSFERTLASTGVKNLYVNHISVEPDGEGNLRRVYKKNGKRTLDGLIYYTRNCAFEPNSPHYRNIDLTMKQIEASFRWGKPAIVSTHRVNFVGVIDKKPREKGLRELKMLLDAVVKRWPEVEFISNGELSSFYENQ